MITKKIRNLFHLKSEKPHPTCTICKGVCTCKENYIGERNEMSRFDGKNIQTLTKYLNHLDI